MEHIHFKNTGKSLQEQISSISKLVKEHDEKVRHLEERSATRGDLDALAKIKADKTIIDKENAIFAERTQKQLEDKCDLEYAKQRLKNKSRMGWFKGCCLWICQADDVRNYFPETA